MQSIVFYDSFTLTNYTEYQLFVRSYSAGLFKPGNPETKLKSS